MARSVRAKAAVVCGGYVLAVVAAWAAGHVYNARLSTLPYDTSGGMYAAGETMSALGAFLVVALVPTLLALWFLRGNARLWQVIAIASLAFACAGLLAVLAPLVVHEPPRDVATMLLGLLGLAQLLGVPLWTVVFVLLALLAPTRPARRLLIGAVGVELVIGVCSAIHWWVPRPPF